MKWITTAWIIGTTLWLAACKKHDYCLEPPKQDSTCDLVQSYFYIDAHPDEGGGLFPQFRKEIDNAGKVNKVVAGLYTLGLYDSIALLLRYSGNTIYFIDEKIPGDTPIIATFDAANRLQKMVPGTTTTFGNTFLLTEFFYDANRLSLYLVENLFDYHLAYDANGNVTRIYREEDSTDRGLFFTYNLAVTAKRQFYSDHFKLNGVSDAVNLAHFLGWLPDMEPVNKLISYKEVTFDTQTLDDVPNVYEFFLTGHVYDNNGNLIRYNEDGHQYTSVYSCTGEADTAPN